METQEKLYKCFIEARCCQLFYASCIDETCTEEERSFFQELAIQSTCQVNAINDFISEKYNHSFLPKYKSWKFILNG
ncbi:hypothetical protein GCM10008986_35050 [Salinibacillus aidingensis]|uniref:Uncharacterized protein n=1 Tax=Salinibacillus aidingensis TaxID=237684 RepID=A0ABP3LQA9_9BACI